MVDHSYALDIPYYFTPKGFELRLVKSDSCLEFEAEELRTSNLYAYKLREEERKSLDVQNLYPNLNDLFQIIMDGFYEKDSLKTEMTSNAEIIVTSLTKVGIKERVITVVTIPLVQQNLKQIDLVERLIDRFDERKEAISQNSQNISMVNILKHMVQQQREVEDKLKETALAAVNNAQPKSNEIPEEIKKQIKEANTQIEEMKKTQKRNLEETNKQIDALQTELSLVKKEFGKVETSIKEFCGEEFPKLKLEIAEVANRLQDFAKTNDEKVLENKKLIEDSISQILEKIVPPSNSQVNQNDVGNATIRTLQSAIEGMKGEAKLLVEMIHAHNIRCNEEIKKLDVKNQETKSDLITMIIQSREQAPNPIPNANDNQNAGPVAIDNSKLKELSDEIKKLKEKTVELSGADSQLEIIVQTMRRQLKVWNCDTRLKVLEKHNGIQPINDYYQDNVEVFIHTKPEFDIEESTVFRVLNNKLGFETKNASQPIENLFMGKSPLPKTGKFSFSMSVNVLVQNPGVFAIGIAGSSFKVNETFIAPGSYFINPIDRILYLNEVPRDYVGEQFQQGQIIKIKVDLDNCMIYFYVNDKVISELRMEIVADEYYPCIFAQNCKDLKLNFV